MNHKKIILLILMLISVLLYSSAVNGAVVQYNTLNNFTLTVTNGGTMEFLYDGQKNGSYDLAENWILVNGSLNAVNYSVLSGQSWGIYEYGNTLLNCTTSPASDTTYTYSKVYCTDGDDDGTNAIIKVNSNNINLVGNRIQVIGNGSGQFLTMNYKDNINVSGFNLQDYYEAIYSSGSVNSSIHDMNFTNITNNYIRMFFSDNMSIHNITFYGNSTGNMVYFGAETPDGVVQDNIFNCTTQTNFEFMIRYRNGSNNNVFKNNIIDNCEGVYTDGTLPSHNITIVGNQFINTFDDSFTNIYIWKSNHSNVSNNYFRDGDNKIRTNQADNTVIEYNNQSNTSNIYFIEVLNSNNTYVHKNWMNHSDVSINIMNSSNTLVDNNTMLEALTGTDDWKLNILIRKGNKNTTIINNYFDYVSAGMLIRNSTNTNVYNNSFNQKSIADKILNSWNDKYEPTCAVCALQKYKGWFDGDPYQSINISIKDNTYNENVQTYLRIEGEVSINHDFSTYWYRAFNVSGYSNQTDTDKFWNNIAYDILTVYTDGLGENDIFFKSGSEVSGASGNSVVNYSISKNNLTFKNVNDTESYTLTVYNLTSLGLGSIYNITDTLDIQLLVPASYETGSYSIPPGNIYAIYENCTIPYVGITITEDTTMCDDSYNLFSSGNIIIANKENITINMNGATIRGNDSGYGINIQKSNITIKNGNFIEFYVGVQISNNLNFSKVYNNSFTLMNNSAVLSYGKEGTNISDNTIQGYAGFTDRGIYINHYAGLLNGNKTIVQNNNINGTYRGIYFLTQQPMIRNIITNNTINNTNYTSIELQKSNYTILSGNRIDYPGHNGIDFDVWYSNVTYNTISNYDHNGIDMLQDNVNTQTFGGYNNIQFNTILDALPTTESNGILVYNTIYNNISNNIITNVYGNGLYEAGIATEANTTTGYGNHVFNNTVNNAKYCLWDGSNQSIFQENILSNCTSGTYFIKNYNNQIGVLNSVAVTFKNNIVDTKETILIQSKTKYITINESPYQLIVNLSNGANIYWYGTNQKYLSIQNITIQVSQIGDISNVFNSSQATPIATNVDNDYVLNQTIAAGGRVFVFTYDADTNPKIVKIDTTVTDISYAFVPKQLTVEYAGTGDVNASQLAPLIGSSGYYIHQLNGIDKAISKENGYVMSPGLNVIYGAANLPMQLTSPTSSTILKVGLGSILAVLILIIAGWPLFGDITKWTTENWLKYFLYSIILIIFGLVTVGIIFNV